MSVFIPNAAEFYAAESIADVQTAVTKSSRLLVRGAGTKTALSRISYSSAAAQTLHADVLELSRLAGILEYNPGEFVFTALAGTPLAVVEAELAQHGQYLPFNPPLAARGATLGGTVAAGLKRCRAPALWRAARLLYRCPVCRRPGPPGAQRRQGRQKRGGFRPAQAADRQLGTAGRAGGVELQGVPEAASLCARCAST